MDPFELLLDAQFWITFLVTLALIGFSYLLLRQLGWWVVWRHDRAKSIPISDAKVIEQYETDWRVGYLRIFLKLTDSI